MKILKGHVKNWSQLEGCIVERYIEVVEFYTEYLSNVNYIGLPTSWHDGRTYGEGIMGNKVDIISNLQWKQAHLYVLYNSIEVEEYVEMHMTELKRDNPNR